MSSRDKLPPAERSAQVGTWTGETQSGLDVWVRPAISTLFGTRFAHRCIRKREEGGTHTREGAHPAADRRQACLLSWALWTEGGCTYGHRHHACHRQDTPGARRGYHPRGDPPLPSA